MTLVSRDRRIAKTVFNHNDTTFWHWVFAFNYTTPYIIEEGIHSYANPSAKRAMKVIRDLVYRSTALRMTMWDERLFVAPSDWPTGFDALRAFGLHEPPTPYECACALLVAPSSSRFWGFKGIPPLGKAVAYWWMAGMQPEAIAELVRGTTLGPVMPWQRLMETYFQQAMKQRKFALWALGTNPIPACANRKAAQIVEAALQGKRLGLGTSSRPYQRAWKGVLEHPYIATQFKTGRRQLPIERTLYRPGIVWPTLEEKLEHFRRSGPDNEYLATTIAWLERRVYHPPKWLRPLTTTGWTKYNPNGDVTVGRGEQYG